MERIEAGGGEITLEQILHAYSQMGGRLTVTELPPHQENGGHKRKEKSEGHGMNAEKLDAPEAANNAR